MRPHKPPPVRKRKTLSLLLRYTSHLEPSYADSSLPYDGVASNGWRRRAVLSEIRSDHGVRSGQPHLMPRQIGSSMPL